MWDGGIWKKYRAKNLLFYRGSKLDKKAGSKTKFRVALFSISPFVKFLFTCYFKINIYGTIVWVFLASDRSTILNVYNIYIYIKFVYKIIRIV